MPRSYSLLAIAYCSAALFACGGGGGLGPPSTSSVTVSPAVVSVLIGDTVALSATVADAEGTTLPDRAISWASAEQAIATISRSGVVTGIAAGSTEVSATSEGKSGAAQVVVMPAPAASITITPNPITLGVGQSQALKATPKDAAGATLEGRTIAWASSAAGVAVVTDVGVLIGVATGQATVTARSEGVSASVAVTVTALPPVAVATVTVSPQDGTITVDETLQLTASLADAQGRPLAGRVVTWSSANDATATVSSAGIVTGRSPGTVAIAATSEGKTGTTRMTVQPVPPASVATVIVSPPMATVDVDGTVQLTAALADAQGRSLTDRTVSWSSATAGTATVSTTGIVTGKAPGTVTVTAASEGKTGTSEITVSEPAADFSIQCPAATVAQNASASTFCTANLQVGTSSLILFGVTGAPGGMIVVFSPNPITPPNPGSGSSFVDLNVDGTVAPGSYTLTISGERSGRTISTPLEVTVTRGTAAVHAVYLVPADRTANPAYTTAIDQALTSIQGFYHDQLANGRNFRLATAHVSVVQSGKPAAFFATPPAGQASDQATFFNNVTAEGLELTGGRFFDPDNIWIYYIDADPACGQFGGAGTSGVTELPANDLRGLAGLPQVAICPGDTPDTSPISRWIGGLGHEIGHAFGLPHPASCEAGDPSCPGGTLMWLGYLTYPNTDLLESDKALLNGSRYFTVGPADVLPSTAMTASPQARAWSRAQPSVRPVP